MIVLTIAGFLISLLSCQQERNIESSQVLTVENDSIIRWIERSKDETLSNEEQAEWLQIALQEARNQPDDSLKAEYLSQISLQYKKRKDSLQFRKTSKEALELAITRRYRARVVACGRPAFEAFEREGITLQIPVGDPVGEHRLENAHRVAHGAR